MKNDKEEGQFGNADPKILNAVNEIPGLEMMSKAGEKLAARTAPDNAFLVRSEDKK
jgi:hypothetical protein